MKANSVSFFVLLCLFISACAAPSQQDAPETGTDTPPSPTEPTQTAQPIDDTPTPVPTATPGPNEISSLPHNPVPGRTLYTISAVMEYPEKTIAANQTVTYVNDGETPLNEILLIVDTNWEAGIFTLDAIRWENEDAIGGYELKEGILRIPLGNALMPEGSITFQVAFSLTIPSRPGVFGYTEQQINLGNWYPFIPPHNPDLGWLAYRPGPVGEYLSYDIADVALQLTLLDAPENTTIAAPAVEQVEGNTYRYEFKDTRGFSLSISDRYSVQRDFTGEIEIVYYSFLDLPKANSDVSQVAVESLSLFSERFGPYPHEKLAVVQGDFPDGMEFDGLIYIGREWYEQHESSPASILSFITAHEVAHQWWYGVVGTNQAMEPWLDEALSTYSEILYYEAYHPNFATWWWDFRVYFYNPETGNVNDPIYKYGSFRLYIDAIYLRGAMFLDAVRTVVGDAAFFAALNDYAQSNRQGETTADDFFAALAAHSDADLSVYIDIYFGE